MIVDVYHGQFFSVAGGNTVNFIISEITLITHEHDGNVLQTHVLLRIRKTEKLVKHKEMKRNIYVAGR